MADTTYTSKNAAGVTKSFRAYEDSGNLTLYSRPDAALTGLVGEVQASPTANTVLARLKDLLSLIVLATGSNLVGRVQIDAQAANGGSPYRNMDLGTTGQVVKASAGNIYSIHAINTNASARYLKVYNKATAPTQSDTPIFTFALAQGSINVFLGNAGISCAAGISLRASTGIADADTGAPSANDVVVNLSYK